MPLLVSWAISPPAGVSLQRDVVNDITSPAVWPTVGVSLVLLACACYGIAPLGPSIASAAVEASAPACSRPHPAADVYEVQAREREAAAPARRVAPRTITARLPISMRRRAVWFSGVLISGARKANAS